MLPYLPFKLEIKYNLSFLFPVIYSLYYKGGAAKMSLSENLFYLLPITLTAYKSNTTNIYVTKQPHYLIKWNLKYLVTKLFQ